MLKLKPTKVLDFEPSMIAKDKDDECILMIDVRASDFFALTDINILKMENYQEIPFLMFVNSNIIRIFKSPNFEEILRLDTKKILNFYDQEISTKTISKSYLKGLISAWLDDLAYYWKSQQPPQKEAINNIGLLNKLLHGQTWELEL